MNHDFAKQPERTEAAVAQTAAALPRGLELTIPKGIDKPYFDRNGVIWLKAGADKRRVNSKEELRRFFQMSDQFHADTLPTRAGPDALDKLRFRDFLRDKYGQEFPDDPAERLRLLKNMNLATDEGKLNLAGLLLFGEQPEFVKPQFVVKAVSFPGTSIHVTTYEDTEDFTGPFRRVFDGALGFVLRNLRKVQAGQGVNSLGIPEIPPVVFEELLVNALVHRDYLVSASIRLFVFSNRIEIISPGHLPNSLTVEKIRAGNSNLRNPILASYVAKGILPYRGLGSGVPRAIEFWPKIDFRDDREGCLFVATVHRDGSAAPATDSEKTREKTREKILGLIRANPAITTAELAEAAALTPKGVEWNIRRLKVEGRLRRVGADKGGRWEVLK